MEIRSTGTAGYTPPINRNTPGKAQGDSDTASTAADSKPASNTNAATAAQKDDEKPSAIKSLAYGTLGLEKPVAEKEEPKKDEPQKKDDEYYTAGRWIAAAVTVGSIISILV